jgi:hypothetical protein
MLIGPLADQSFSILRNQLLHPRQTSFAGDVCFQCALSPGNLFLRMIGLLSYSPAIQKDSKPVNKQFAAGCFLTSRFCLDSKLENVYIHSSPYTKHSIRMGDGFHPAICLFEIR